jgi:hypothetical protein
VGPDRGPGDMVRVRVLLERSLEVAAHLDRYCVIICKKCIPPKLSPATTLLPSGATAPEEKVSIASVVRVVGQPSLGGVDRGATATDQQCQYDPFERTNPTSEEVLICGQSGCSLSRA